MIALGGKIIALAAPLDYNFFINVSAQDDVLFTI